MKNQALITWTHSEYSDIWPLYFGRLEKHFKYDKSYIFVDKKTNKIPEKHIQLVNNDRDPWYKRFIECLDKVEEEQEELEEDEIDPKPRRRRRTVVMKEKELAEAVYELFMNSGTI